MHHFFHVPKVHPFIIFGKKKKKKKEKRMHLKNVLKHLMLCSMEQDSENVPSQILESGDR